MNEEQKEEEKDPEEWEEILNEKDFQNMKDGEKLEEPDEEVNS